MSGTPLFPFPRSPVLPFYRGLSPVLPFYLLVSLVSAASGQVSPGDRIRVKHACEGEAKPAPCRTEVGKVNAVVGDTIVLDDNGTGERRLVLGPASRIELSTGRHGHALLGLGVGLVAGIAVGAVSVHGCQARSDSDMGGLCVLQYFLTVPVGAISGIIIGAVLKSDKWHTVNRPASRLEVVPGISPNGVAVSGKVSF